MWEISLFDETGEIAGFNSFAEADLKDSLVKLAGEEDVEVNSLSIVVLDDQSLKELNKEYLQHDYFTDVITFNLSEDEKISGEIYVSIDRVKENAKEYNVPETQELCRVFFHGLLHLIGYGDKSQEEQKEMREKEDYYLNKYSSTWNSSEENV